jgi:hypothetical protein
VAAIGSHLNPGAKVLGESSAQIYLFEGVIEGPLQLLLLGS